VNQIKLDKAFLMDSPNECLLGSIIRMSHEMNLEVVTEGVETAFQDCILTKQNCDIGQGFFFGRPVSAVEFVSFYHKTFPLSDFAL
jgi:EAL domain-containing protein (putative c-di-GMP-specific phosphodiesterase class I)